ncbi:MULTISPECIES: sigma factor-like helix-turn-helix DNA-binding protein [unclassified Streptomyces]|uniref:sigma factor-like helix-turn-helix DNA-binding protein n=1 Tax=unclassified Streptomyces TaxID=2593676 RepID=UPI0016556ECC|nr:sigma factor-like helix-turn-helix DNA-binding protein [Streptomyces sp. CB02980]MCB8903324.1 RNA polymerase subunit sigma-70 [Streptomyces sp. CB02980]
MHDDTFPAALAGRFDAHEEQLRHVALRMTGSEAEAEEALAAVRAGLGRDDGASVRAWLTALVTRECVRGLQRRRAGEGPGRRSAAGAGGGSEVRGAAGAGVGGESRGGGESVWLALFLVLESLGAEERLAYVLHDAFGLPSYETARITGDSPEEVARLARRARERVRGHGTARAEGGVGRQRAVVDLFLAAARARDARTLAAVLDPDVVAHSERGPVHGAPAVAEGAAAFARFADVARPALVDGAVGAVAFVDGRPVSAVAFTLRRDRIVSVSVTTGEDRVRALDLVFSDG